MTRNHIDPPGFSDEENIIIRNVRVLESRTENQLSRDGSIRLLPDL